CSLFSGTPRLPSPTLLPYTTLFRSMLATFVVAGFETTLEARIAIAFFVPGIVYLADAVGTQSEAIAVRGLSLSRLPLARLLAGRSEEHTSELQSRENLVCRLLLETK